MKRGNILTKCPIYWVVFASLIFVSIVGIAYGLSYSKLGSGGNDRKIRIINTTDHAIKVIDALEGSVAGGTSLEIGDRIKFDNCRVCLIQQGDSLEYWAGLSEGGHGSVILIAFHADTKIVFFKQLFFEDQLIQMGWQVEISH